MRTIRTRVEIRVSSADKIRRQMPRFGRGLDPGSVSTPGQFSGQAHFRNSIQVFEV
jgi:hypothetical protein